MDKRRKSVILIEICLCFISIVSSFSEEVCDKTKCPGPLQFYKELRCKPIYKNPEDCCAIKYDCSHLKERSTEKCYVNDNVYEIGDELKAEDALPCDIGCTCEEGFRGIATFSCAEVDCPSFDPTPGCYLQHSSNECCPIEVCPEAEERAKCVVNGTTYLEGDYFEVEGEPHKSCYCKPGYQGENVEPFCSTPKGDFCGIDLRSSYEIKEMCSPVYYNKQSPQNDCSVSYRCQNRNDILISKSGNAEKSADDESAICTFGNIEMQIGDELNQATDYSSVCVKCICEVPPIPTCQRLPDDECDVTVHPEFDTY